MSKAATNNKFAQIAKLMGFDAVLENGMWSVIVDGTFAGQMSADAWLDHIKHSMTAKKS